MSLGSGLILLYELGDGRGISWNDLTQDRNRRRAIVNEVMNLHVP
jgi:hypothetical protein